MIQSGARDSGTSADDRVYGCTREEIANSLKFARYWRSGCTSLVLPGTLPAIAGKSLGFFIFGKTLVLERIFCFEVIDFIIEFMESKVLRKWC